MRFQLLKLSGSWPSVFNAKTQGRKDAEKQRTARTLTAIRINGVAFRWNHLARFDGNAEQLLFLFSLRLCVFALKTV